MNWKQTFTKPKWQHKDAEIRLEAVSSGQEPELIAGLLEPRSGRVEAHGRTALVFQNPDHQIIFPTVEEELSFVTCPRAQQRVKNRVLGLHRRAQGRKPRERGQSRPTRSLRISSETHRARPSSSLMALETVDLPVPGPPAMTLSKTVRTGRTAFASDSRVQVIPS